MTETFLPNSFFEKVIKYTFDFSAVPKKIDWYWMRRVRYDDKKRLRTVSESSIGKLISECLATSLLQISNYVNVIFTEVNG